MKQAGTTYEDLIAHNPAIAEIISEDRLNFVKDQTRRTTRKLDEIWNRQLRKNAKTLYRKHGLIQNSCAGFGTNKATVAIGAGPSFNKNKELLKRLNHWNALFPFEKQPFLFVVSNHQFKDCLDFGIVPHFVLLVDASDAVDDHLLNGVSPRGQNVPLICCLHCHPKILKEWDRQGKLIQFFVTTDEDKGKIFEETTGHKLNGKTIMPGGNVVNVAWAVSRMVFDSSVFICVGNDLSYPISESEEERRGGYYADGDYTANLKTGRDEAQHQFKWLGFDLSKNPFTDEPRVDFNPVATVPSLYGYKTWIETTVAIQDGFKLGMKI